MSFSLSEFIYDFKVDNMLRTSILHFSPSVCNMRYFSSHNAF